MKMDIQKRSETELQANLEETLARKTLPLAGGLWLFVYGLLAKELPFEYTEKHVTTLVGWQRRFNLQDPLNRGTEESPGLTLGLESGGECTGLAYLIPKQHAPKALQEVWKQEMLLPFYLPSWILQGNKELLVMIADPASPYYKSEQNPQTTANTICHSKGEAGTNFAYLTEIIRAFKEAGVEDPYLQNILDLATK